MSCHLSWTVAQVALWYRMYRYRLLSCTVVQNVPVSSVKLHSLSVKLQCGLSCTVGQNVRPVQWHWWGTDGLVSSNPPFHCKKLFRSVQFSTQKTSTKSDYIATIGWAPSLFYPLLRMNLYKKENLVADQGCGSGSGSRKEKFEEKT